MHLHLLSQDDAYVDCIKRSLHVPMRAATGNEPSVPKPRHEWSNPDIEQVRKDKKAMNILFNGVDGDMFDNIINCKTAKELLNALKLHGRVYQTKDSNIKFLRSLPKEWKPMIVSLRNSQDYKEFTFERLYDILKTYALEIEQDEKMEKGRKKGGSIALVAKLEKEKEIKVEAVESTLKVCESKGKGLVAENEDQLSQDNMDDIDEHLVFLSMRFSKLKFKKNFGIAKPNRNMIDNGRNNVLESQFIEFEKLRIECKTAKDELTESLKKEEISRKQLKREHESKEKLDSNQVEGFFTDMDSTDDENHPSDNQKDYPLRDKEPHMSAVSKPNSKSKLVKLNEKYGSVSKDFVPGQSSQVRKEKKVNVGHMSIKQLNDRLENIEVKTEAKKKNNRNGNVGINKHNNYTPDKYAPRKICVKCGSVNHLFVNCKIAMPTPMTTPSSFSNMTAMSAMPMNAMPAQNMNAQFANISFAPNLYYPAFSMPQMPFSPTQMTKDESEIPKSNEENRKNLWYLDSGCSRHMTGDSTLLTEIKERAGPSITSGDDSKGYTVGYGLISKDNVIIEEVALVNGLKHNLLSISQLCDKGNSVTFNIEACVVTNKRSNKVVLTGVRKGNVSSPASKPLANVRDANQGVSTFGAVLDMVTDRPGFVFMSLLALDIASHWLQMYSTFLVGKAIHKDVKDNTSWLFRVLYITLYSFQRMLLQSPLIALAERVVEEEGGFSIVWPEWLIKFYYEMLNFQINKVLSKLECWVMKELDNKGNNVSGFQGFGLSKHKISWIEYIIIQFSVCIHALMTKKLESGLQHLGYHLSVGLVWTAFGGEVRSRATELKFAAMKEINLLEGRDVHIHFPAGAIPKDGPSAGVTLLTALVLLFSQTKVRSDTTMTREMTLRGLGFLLEYRLLNPKIGLRLRSMLYWFVPKPIVRRSSSRICTKAGRIQTWKGLKYTVAR
ncbi:hypothetical protein AgCh_032501 [Apium graveolens]